VVVEGDAEFPLSYKLINYASPLEKKKKILWMRF